MDVDEIQKTAEEARRLARESRYCERIEPLLEAQIGEAVLPYDYDPQGYRQSNCHGTILYVLERKLDIPSIENESGERLVLQGDLGRPGFVGAKVMANFLEGDCEELSRPEVDSILTFWVIGDLKHSGVYVGKANGKDIFFHQQDTGRPFELGLVGWYHPGLYERRLMIKRFFKPKTS